MAAACAILIRRWAGGCGLIVIKVRDSLRHRSVTRYFPPRYVTVVVMVLAPLLSTLIPLFAPSLHHAFRAFVLPRSKDNENNLEKNWTRLDAVMHCGCTGFNRTAYLRFT